MQTCLALIAVVLALPLAVRPNENSMLPSTTANIKIGKTIEITRLDEPVFRNVVCDFSITPASSSPPSVILAGKVVNNNSGTVEEFVPIFFGSTLHHPRLAALTNVNGEFRFRVWLVDKPTGKPPALAARETAVTTRLQALMIREGILYLEGKFDKDGEMASGYTHIHSLREVGGLVSKKKS